MKRSNLKVLVLLIAIVAALLFIQSCSRMSSTNQKPIAHNNWKADELCDFSYAVPPNLEMQNVQGTDSLIRQYQNSDLRIQMLCLETGSLESDFQRSKGQHPESSIETVEINGKQARWCTYRANESEFGKIDMGLPDKEHSYVVEMYFIEPYGKGSPNLLAAGRSFAEQEMAKEIFRTLKFK